MAKKITKKQKESAKKGGILIVDSIKNMPKELKDFMKKPVSSCPFCGKEPHKDVVSFGASDEEIENLKNEDDYKENQEYKKSIDDYIKTNKPRSEFRISCIEEGCLHPSTDFQPSAEEAEAKWNARHGDK